MREENKFGSQYWGFISFFPSIPGIYERPIFFDTRGLSNFCSQLPGVYLIFPQKFRGFVFERMGL